MKPFFNLILIFFTVISFASAQDYQSFTAKEAYDYLKSQNSLNNFEITSLMAIQMAGADLFTIDVPSGTANNWTFSLKSTDKNDTITYMIIVMKALDQFIVMDDQDPSTNAQDAYSFGSMNWVNSDVIANKVKTQTDFYNFYKANLNNFSYNMFAIINSDVTDTSAVFSWVVSLVTKDNQTAYCLYDPITGNNQICEVNPNYIKSVEQILTKHFPNPTSGIVNFETDLSGSINLKVFNNFGNQVLENNLTVDKNFQIDLSNLPTGFYNIIINSESGIITKKIIINK